MEDVRRKEETVVETPKAFKRPNQQALVPLVTKDEYLRRQLARMSVDEGAGSEQDVEGS